MIEDIWLLPLMFTTSATAVTKRFMSNMLKLICKTYKNLIRYNTC